MRQVTVPQFIDVEDKIIGPITVRQFLLLVVGGLFIFLEFKLSDIALFILLAIPTFAVVAVFAFVKINSVPFHYFMLNMIQTLKKPKLRIWIRETIVESAKKQDAAKMAKEAAAKMPVARIPLTGSKISDLSLIIDTGGIYQGEEAELSKIDFHQNKSL